MNNTTGSSEPKSRVISDKERQFFGILANCAQKVYQAKQQDVARQNVGTKPTTNKEDANNES